MSKHDHRDRVLLIAEDRIDAEDIATLVSPEMRCDVSQDSERVPEVVEAGRYDLLFVDAGLGGGARAVAILHRMHDSSGDVPIILLSADGASPVVSAGLKLNAFHYVLTDPHVVIRDLIHIGKRAIACQSWRKLARLSRDSGDEDASCESGD